MQDKEVGHCKVFSEDKTLKKQAEQIGFNWKGRTLNFR